ncbi:MAG: hypothetical protein PWQ84_1346 [Thermotogaceae bacterium]|nr:hypothetical protein [Thermotogaceae bacterium]
MTIKCSRCGKREARRIQKIHDDGFEKEIAYCDFCLNEMITYDSVELSKTHMKSLVERANLFDDKPPKNYKGDDNIILILLMPHLIVENMFEHDLFTEKRIKKTIIETQIIFYDLKVEKARQNEEYENALRYQKISKGLRKYLKRNKQ